MDLNSAQVINAILPFSPKLAILGIALFIIGVFIFLLIMKRLIINIIFGLIAFLTLKILGFNLPLLATLLATLVFGLGGLGTILILHFFGIL